MDLATIALAIGVAGFGGFGAFLLANPRGMNAVDIAAESPNARAELRAMYGGLEIGLAVFLIMCIGKPSWTQPGLIMELLAIGGIALGRLIGIAMERGQVKPLLWFFFAVEAAASVFIGAALLGGT